MSSKVMAQNSKLRFYEWVCNESLAILLDLTINYRVEADAGDEQLAVQYLGVQMLNSARAAWSLAMSGYYQQSGILQRHVLETGFLLDYFRADLEKARTWWQHARQRPPSGLKMDRVIAALDRRDGIRSGCRGETYGLLSNLCAHPAPVSRRLVVSEGYRMCSPFFDRNALVGTSGELARMLPYFACVVVELLPVGANQFLQDLLQFRKVVNQWTFRCYGASIDTATRQGMTDYARRLWGHTRRAAK